MLHDRDAHTEFKVSRILADVSADTELGESPKLIAAHCQHLGGSSQCRYGYIFLSAQQAIDSNGCGRVYRSELGFYVPGTSENTR